MPSNSLDLAQSVIVVAGTYLLHSTILLAGAWLVVKIVHVRSHALAERLWKMAAVLGLVTAPVQLALGWSSPILDVTLIPTENMRYAAGGEANSAASRPLSLESLGETAGVDQRVLGAAPFGSGAVDTSELAGGLDGDGYRGTALEDTVVGLAQLSNDESNYLPAATSDTTEGESSRVLIGEEPLGSGQSFQETAAASRWSNSAVLPSTIATLEFVGTALTMGFVICGLFVLLVQTSLFRRRCAGSCEMDDGPARRILDRLLQKDSIRRQVCLLTSDAFDEPVAFGLVRWTIVLPNGIEQRLGKDELKGLLAHELAHLVRGDALWLWAGRLLCSCLAFQPLNFLARRRWQHAVEFLCDDWAIGRGVGAISLARCLTRIAEWRLEDRECAAGLAAAGSKATIVLRVERLVSATGPVDVWARPLRHGLLRAAVVVVAACFVCVAPRVVYPVYAAGEQDRDAQANLGESESGLRRKGIVAPAVTPADDWQLLEQELLQLDRDVSFAYRLLRHTSHGPEVHESADQMRRHVSVLQQRRHALAGRIGKELDR